MRAMPATQLCLSPGSVIEFGLQKAAAILGRLRVSRPCAYTSIALRSAHPAGSGASPHLYPDFSGTAQACLAFAKSAPRTPEFNTRWHPPALKATADKSASGVPL